MDARDYILTRSKDLVKQDLELRCTWCDKHLCDAESGDLLSVLVSVAAEHECPRSRRRRST